MTSQSPRDWVLAAFGLVAIPVVTLWNRLQVVRESPLPHPDDPEIEPLIVEHERSWVRYLRGFDAHHGVDGRPDRSPSDGDLLAGLARWAAARFLRGYTLGDHVYLCPAAPRVVRIHQAGHTPAFGEVFEPMATEYRSDGGLPDEPLRTLDVMLPGSFPHTFLRLSDRRGLAGAYRTWYHDGRIQRLGE